METVSISGIPIEYEISGSGEPVVLIHGALIADVFRPLVEQPEVMGRFNFITYHRQGYQGSGRSGLPVRIERQASDLRSLLQSLGIKRAHILGHSFGGVVALELALSEPDLVQSLMLLEPALLIGDSAAGYRESMLHIVEEYESGNVVALVDGVWQARFGANYRGFLDRALPQGFDEAVANAEAAVRIDMPSLLEWPFTEEKARRILKPTLSVLGSDSPALWSRFQETHDALLNWLPDCEGYVLPGATHALQIQNPRDMAQAMVAFLTRNRIEAA